MSIIDCDRNTEGKIACSIQKVENSAYTTLWINASLSRSIAEAINNNIGIIKKETSLSNNQIDIFLNSQCMNSITNLWLHFESFINYLLVKKGRKAIADTKLSTIDKWILFSEFEKSGAGEVVKSSNEYGAMKFLKKLRNDLAHNRYKAYEYYVEFTKSERILIFESRNFKAYDFPRNSLDLKPNHVCYCFEITEAFYQSVIDKTNSDLLKSEYESRFVYGKTPLFSGEYYLSVLKSALLTKRN